MAAKVDKEKCTGCGLCVEACPMDIIVLQDDVAVVEEEECTDCGECVEECPEEAIELE
ncbi:indolepyruvate ferredoxin oxidoreductase subunit alpha [Natranaerofaba carboxydovora]|uniref:indolepyruvate ferredoxin oxidoreductase subunit alpha n=1 Tax=Natranaerofaba carboxydovora TaxID=2742683 RepID=UPI001F13C796|nr:4Fe-4S binding protein [Natranaerofaba carboxydovora]UMZ72743.1 Caffeyl-CoA reductase-Etf complex subunit CarE [Natranaerofaba carboxydovora]